MEIEKTLEQLGFTKNEIKVYLALNETGTSKVSEISKITNIDRSNCYDSLKTLINKGVVSSLIMRNVNWFQVTAPERLMGYLQEQEFNLKKIIPELKKKHKIKKVEGTVKLFKGKKGIKTVFLDIIKTGKDNYVFGDEGQMIQKMPLFVEQFDRLKKEKKIKTKLILKKRKEHMPTKTEYRYFENISESLATTNIYGNKIAIIVWAEEPEAVIIENEAVAKSYKSYFDILWKHGKN